MQICVFDDQNAAPRFGASRIAEAARNAIAERDVFALALSGGNSPWPMLAELAAEDVPWAKVHIFQADERIVPMDSPMRNFAGLQKALLSHVPIPPKNIHPMPVEADDIEAASKDYQQALTSVLGNPPVLDVVHLGLGTDGHTASLFPGDADGPASGDVRISLPYEGNRRMTLTYAMLNRARVILWYVMGEDKAPALARMVAGDAAIPAGRIDRSRAIVIADKAAARLLSEKTAPFML